MDRSADKVYDLHTGDGANNARIAQGSPGYCVVGAMAHFQQQKFVEAVKSLFPEFFERTRVLEVGSWSFNGSVRDQFESCDYIGTDVAPGNGVDVPVAGQDLAFPTASFDVVITCECFEHNPFWLETFVNMTRMLRPGGLCILTCAGTGRGEHGTNRTSPANSLTAIEQHEDYYRNFTRWDIEAGVDLARHFSHHRFFDNRYSKDLYFVGVRRAAVADPALAGRMAALGEMAGRITLKRPPTLIRTLSAHGEWWTKWFFARLLGERRYHDVRHFIRPRTPRRIGTARLPTSSGLWV
jgi:SAM-dependent methyltransferase